MYADTRVFNLTQYSVALATLGTLRSLHWGSKLLPKSTALYKVGQLLNPCTRQTLFHLSNTKTMFAIL
jgi:hypothetical protein